MYNGHHKYHGPCYFLLWVERAGPAILTASLLFLLSCTTFSPHLESIVDYFKQIIRQEFFNYLVYRPPAPSG